MNPPSSLGSFGNRIIILGPSNSGKSTLSLRLSKKLGIKAYHLDQLAHYQDTNWQRRPDSELLEEQKKIIKQPSWIIDGNYQVCMQDRLASATTALWIDPPLIGCLWRYCWRSLINDPNRPGRLKGSKREFSWGLIKYTINKYPKNRLIYQTLLQQHPHLCVIRFKSISALNQFYKDNQF